MLVPVFLGRSGDLLMRRALAHVAGLRSISGRGARSSWGSELEPAHGASNLAERGTAAAQGVLAVNLANQGGSEGTLGRSFKAEAERYAKIKPGFEVVNFDFHHECKGMRYDRCAPATRSRIADPSSSYA